MFIQYWIITVLKPKINGFAINSSQDQFHAPAWLRCGDNKDAPKVHPPLRRTIPDRHSIIRKSKNPVEINHPAHPPRYWMEFIVDVYCRRTSLLIDCYSGRREGVPVFISVWQHFGIELQVIPNISELGK